VRRGRAARRHDVVLIGVGAGELVGGLEQVEHRGQAGIEHIVDHEHSDSHGVNDIIGVVYATGDTRVRDIV
jgi:hypothetical protein